MRTPLVLFTVLLTVACAGKPPIDSEGLDTSLAPRAAAERGDESRGKRVLWGGLIVGGENLERGSRIEVLGYPLGKDQRPDRDAGPVGRFLVQNDGYLELADYAPGRLITVAGSISAVREGTIGEASYRFPVVAPEQLHLWSGERRPAEPRVHFGFGVILNR
jgi:outer membrane lipoprotein